MRPARSTRQARPRGRFSLPPGGSFDAPPRVRGFPGGCGGLPPEEWPGAGGNPHLRGGPAEYRAAVCGLREWLLRAARAESKADRDPGSGPDRSAAGERGAGRVLHFYQPGPDHGGRQKGTPSHCCRPGIPFAVLRRVRRTLWKARCVSGRAYGLASIAREEDFPIPARQHFRFRTGHRIGVGGYVEEGRDRASPGATGSAGRDSWRQAGRA